MPQLPETDGGISRRRLLASAAVTTGGLAVGAGAVATAGAATPAAVSGIAGAPPVGASPRPFAPWASPQLYDTAFYRLVGEGAAGGCDFEELFFAAQRIGPTPSREAWTRELAALGRRLIADARGLTTRDPLLAQATALRGQNYLRSAEYFIVPQGPTLASKVAMYREVRAGFALAALTESARPRVSPVRVPYEGKRLYAYLVEPVERRRGASVPAVLFYGGIDTIGEQLLLKAALRFAERGWATLILDGPGMGATLRFLRVPSRYDYEHVTKAGFDWLNRVAWIDPRRIAIVGESLGGYYAIRSAAFEHRARACVNWGGVYNLASSGAAGGRGDKESTDALIAQALWVIGGNSQRRFGQQFPKFNLAGIPRTVRCPTLHIYGEDDDLVPTSDAHHLYAEVPARKTFHLVPSGTPGATHCQSDSLPAAWAPMLPWLSEYLD